MRYHPAILMLIVWGSAALALLVLPFELTYRVVHVPAFFLLGLFILVFCLAALARTVHIPQRPVSDVSDLGFRRTDQILKTISFIALLTMGMEAVRNGSFDLGNAYSQRSQQAQALLHGALSQSSPFFKVGFLCYPASYVYLVRCIVFDRKIDFRMLILFGILPAVFAGIAMGGRAPIFNVIAYGLIAYRMRGLVFAKTASDMEKPRKSGRIHPAVRIMGFVLVVFAFNYFINVFITRAESVGGAEMMLQIAASRWGITFSGPGAEFLIAVLGPVTTYIIFVFVWYLVQGVIMSNSLLTSYEGDPLLGVYGVDIFSAVMRRIDPVGVSQKFNYLLDLDTYGFLPSAFGSLYVDFLFGGLFFVALWGWFTGVVFRKTRLGKDARWLIFVPFIVFGIVFSLINTPVGFSNGFVTHFWLVVAFLSIYRPKSVFSSAPVGAPLTIRP